ncbi:DUF2695 domain-containing protein [Xanthomonas sacchari]|uniref:DUF2695 domain-containing protein n=1 Tax=Xanthomonas sacchari TaxID=56458 RepID=UPI00225E6086|nr:DUF2695 domain-containing protein [Xanthomonas sacchari]UYK81289.1 DUF2695 domain-containing protein [Xanthomonas sacchari]
MADKLEVQRRKQLRRAAEAKQRESEESSLPVPRETLWALFDYLDMSLAVGCDHSLRLTEQFLASREIRPELLVAWLGEYGGFCDCEVLSNVEERWGRL